VPISGLPASLNGFSIGIMADFHAGAWGNEDVIIKAITSMRQLKPDIIVLLGDYVDGARSHDDQNIDNSIFLFQALEFLKAPFGVYAVLGNHDHWTDSKRVIKLLLARNITVLKNENRVLQNGLILLPGNDEMPMNYKGNTFRFRQDSSFLYFIGLDLPGLAVLIDVEQSKTILFGNDFELDDIIWMGPQSALAEQAAAVGIREVQPANKLPDIKSCSGSRRRSMMGTWPAAAGLTLERRYAGTAWE